MKPPADQGGFEYLLTGLEREFADGMARLEKTDAANDHVAWYRRNFERAVRDLREAIERAGPCGYDVACDAWQVAFLARIWPLLKEQRVRESVRARMGPKNKDRRTTARQQQQRCLSIAKTMTRPTAEAIRHRYGTKYPQQPTPAARTISRYLKTL